MNIWLSSLSIRAHFSWRTGKHLHVLHVLRTYSAVHILPSWMVGWNELCNSDCKVQPLICNLQIINSEVQIKNQKLQIKKSWITNCKFQISLQKFTNDFTLCTTAFHGQWNFIMVCKGPLRQHKNLPTCKCNTLKLYVSNLS